MKRIVSLLLALIMVISLSACGNETADKYCSNCGNGLSKRDAFCDECGTQVSGGQKDEKPDASEQTEKSTTTTSVSTTTQKPSTTKAKTTTKAKPTTKARVTTTTTKQKSHTHSYSKKVTPPSCTEKGYTMYSCSCGHSYKDNYVNPAHQYKDYVCTACGAVDKSHAHEHLVMWMKKNGEAKDNRASCVEWIEEDYYCLSHDAEHDLISIYAVIDEKQKVYLSIDDLNYYHSSFYEYELDGFLNAKEHTANTLISYNEYIGSEEDKYEYIELTRIHINQILSWLAEFLAKEGVGITVADLGFTAYQ